jgi:hypothetical protein
VALDAAIVIVAYLYADRLKNRGYTDDQKRWLEVAYFALGASAVCTISLIYASYEGIRSLLWLRPVGVPPYRQFSGGVREVGAESDHRSFTMRAHRVRVRVAKNQELRVTLPSDFPPGDAEVIVLEAPRVEAVPETRKLTVDELLAARLTPPPGVGPVSLEDMDRAITEGAAGRGGV